MKLKSVYKQKFDALLNLHVFLFKFDQCEYTNASEKGLSQHKMMKHRISQIDAMDDFIEEEVIK